MEQLVRLSLSYLLLVVLLISGYVQAGKVRAIIVFGDSTVDAGNNNRLLTLVKGNFKPYGRDFNGGEPTGRFCNGRLVTDFVAQSFGIKQFIPAYLDPSYTIEDFATGVTFASAGTGYDHATSDSVSVIPLWEELEYFKQYKKELTNFMGKNDAAKILQEALYMMSLGTNDFILNYFARPGRSSQFTVEQYENFLIDIAENFIHELYVLGARKISLGGLPPIGCLPFIRSLNVKEGRGCREEFNNLARDFDRKLIALAAKLRRELKEIKLVFSGVLDPALQIIRSPDAYGFSEAAVACCGTGTLELGYLCHATNSLTCKDASKYIFWDAVHPTERLYQLVANILMKTSLAQFV